MQDSADHRLKQKHHSRIKQAIFWKMNHSESVHISHEMILQIDSNHKSECNSLMTPLKLTQMEFRRDLWQQKIRVWAIGWHCFHDPMFSHFSTIPACDTQVDRQTNTRRQHISC